MKTPLLPVALVAVASSLATVGTIELLRGARTRAEAAPGPPSSSTTGNGDPADRSPDLAPAEPAGAPARARALDSADLSQRLSALERRLAALEQAASTRAPVTDPDAELPAQGELRDLVLGWVAEEREARQRAQQVEHEEDVRKTVEFSARHQALVLAQEHDLADWQQDKLYELFLEIETRNEELGRQMNPLEADPEEFERRWAEFDEWAERRYVEVLGQELYDLVFGEHDE